MVRPNINMLMPMSSPVAVSILLLFRCSMAEGMYSTSVMNVASARSMPPVISPVVLMSFVCSIILFPPRVFH